MPANELHFSSDFKDIVTYCKEHELFLGSGNPNVDIQWKNAINRKDTEPEGTIILAQTLIEKYLR